MNYKKYLFKSNQNDKGIIFVGSSCEIVEQEDMRVLKCYCNLTGDFVLKCGEDASISFLEDCEVEIVNEDIKVKPIKI